MCVCVAQVITPESEADRRARLNLDEAERLEAERKKAEADAAAKAALAAARVAANLAARKRARDEAEREMSTFLRQSREEQLKKYNEMLAAALAMLPKPGARANGSDADDEAGGRRRRGPPPPWQAHARPRVERSGVRRTIAFNAAPDRRNPSVAFPRTGEVALMSGSSSSAALLAPSSSSPHLMPRSSSAASIPLATANAAAAAGIAGSAAAATPDMRAKAAAVEAVAAQYAARVAAGYSPIASSPTSINHAGASPTCCSSPIDHAHAVTAVKPAAVLAAPPPPPAHRPAPGTPGAGVMGQQGQAAASGRASGHASGLTRPQSAKSFRSIRSVPTSTHSGATTTALGYSGSAAALRAAANGWRHTPSAAVLSNGARRVVLAVRRLGPNRYSFTRVANCAVGDAGARPRFVGLRRSGGGRPRSPTNTTTPPTASAAASSATKLGAASPGTMATRQCAAAVRFNAARTGAAAGTSGGSQGGSSSATTKTIITAASRPQTAPTSPAALAARGPDTQPPALMPPEGLVNDADLVGVVIEKLCASFPDTLPAHVAYGAHAGDARSPSGLLESWPTQPGGGSTIAAAAHQHLQRPVKLVLISVPGNGRLVEERSIGDQMREVGMTRHVMVPAPLSVTATRGMVKPHRMRSAPVL